MEMNGQLHTPAALHPRKVAGATQLVWMFWRREMSVTPARNQTQGSPAHSLVTVLTELLSVIYVSLNSEAHNNRF
jgi:hypothetical protein